MPGVFRPGTGGGAPVEPRSVEEVPRPVGFNVLQHITVWRSGDAYSTDFRAVNRIQGPTFYVSPGGSGNGSTPGAALPTVAAAIQAINAAGFPEARVIVAPGKYVGGWGETTSSSSISVTCPDGIAVITSDDQSTGAPWALASGSSVRWITTHPTGVFASGGVFDHADPDEFGFAQRLTPVTTEQACEETPGSSFVDGSGALHVHLFDGREPDESVYAPLDVDAATHEHGSLFVENIVFWGGRHVFSGMAEAGSDLVFRNCTFLYGGRSHDNVEVGGGGFVAFVDCTNAQSGLDGWNYDDSVQALESGCRAFNNGHVSTTSGANNASTLHHSASAIRINGVYVGSLNRTVHDVHNSQSWNIACRIGVPVGSQSPQFSVGAGFDTHPQEQRNTRVWLEACEVEGEGYAAEACQLLVRRTIVTPMVLGSAEPY